MTQRRAGSVWIHASPSHLLKQIGWSISRTLRYEVFPVWARQPGLQGNYYTRVDWFGDADTAATLASMLAGWRTIYFEVDNWIEDQPSDRWLFVPGLGIRHRSLDAFGNLVIGENEIRLAIEVGGADHRRLKRELQNLLADPWEAALEPLRLAETHPGDDSLVRAG